jgi:cobalt-zinc-cadmium efflux system protein
MKSDGTIPQNHAQGDGHEHRHPHAHGHDHRHAPANFGRAFAIGIVVNFGFVVVESVYGVIANSMALLADAGHNFGDVLGLLTAWGASVLSRRIPTRRYTYGLRSTTILAALSNAVLLLLAVGAIGVEAIQRLLQPAPVAEHTVIAVSFIGVVVNGVTALMFMSGRKDDLNIHGAFLHMVSDAAVSLGVVIAGFVILSTGWLWLDPAVSLGIAAIIFLGTWRLLRGSVNLALDAVPEGIEPDTVRRYLVDLPDVEKMHDLHIWAMSTTETALTCHLVMPTGHPDDARIAQIAAELNDRFGIAHVTIQVETGDPGSVCVLVPDHVV